MNARRLCVARKELSTMTSEKGLDLVRRTIFHLGVDSCDRLSVLKEVGCHVETFVYLKDLADALSSRKADAVAISESRNWSFPPDLLPTIKEVSTAPLILMQDADHSRDYRYDLQVAPQTVPSQWLREIELLIAKSCGDTTRSNIFNDRKDTSVGERAPGDHLGGLKESGAQTEEERCWIDPRVRPYRCFLNSAFWSSLARGSRKELLSLIEISERTSRTDLLVEGRPVTYACILIEGSAKIYIKTARSGRILLHVAAPGDVVGLDAIMLGQSSKSSAETMTRSTVGTFRCDRFLEFLSTNPSAAQAAARQLSKACSNTIARLRTINPLVSSRTKVARLLFQWSEEGKRTAGGVEVYMPLNRNEIAECIGIASETVSRTISDLRRLQLIDERGPLLTISNRLKPASFSEAQSLSGSSCVDGSDSELSNRTVRAIESENGAARLDTATGS
jgi:CRP/FNR family transcriptional regulator